MAQSPNKRSIYVGPELREVLGPVESGGLSARLNRIGDRYSEIIDRQRIPMRFCEAELSLLKDSLNGTIHEPAAMIRGVAAGVEDSITLDGLADKWSVDGPALLEKLRALDFVGEVALVEYVEAFWARVAGGDSDEAE